MRTRLLQLGALASLSLLSLGLVPVGTAAAQADGSQTIVKDLSFEHTDARWALRQVFKAAGVSYTLDPAFKDGVTAEFKNVPFEKALQNVLQQIDATYRIEGGVYQIVPIHPESDPKEPSSPAEPPTVTVDGSSVFVFHSGTLYKIDKESMKVVG